MAPEGLRISHDAHSPSVRCPAPDQRCGGTGLLVQAVERIFETEESLALQLGQCALAYPQGINDPVMVRARDDVEAIGFEPLTTGSIRLRNLRFNERAQEAGELRITGGDCVLQIDDAAMDL